MLYDCFTFFNELELLDIRLHELDKIVDKFVLVESTVTFTNKKKELFYESNKSQFKKFQKKIIHIVVDDSPDVNGNPWIIENYQFSSISNGLKKCKSDDLILISFVDEIPKCETIIRSINKPGKHKAFMQDLAYYYLNYFVDNADPWLGTRMLKYKDLLLYKSPYIARFTTEDVQIPDGGWHFSYMGGVKKIKEKIASFSHQEFNNPSYNTEEKIFIAIQEGQDIFRRGLKFKFIDYSLLPEHVQKNRGKFQELLSQPKPINTSVINYLKIKSFARAFVRKILIGN